ncbi:MAG: oxygen-dependent tRNA uridine(34) hydroxylase TrhO [Hyphomicrobium sp.]
MQAVSIEFPLVDASTGSVITVSTFYKFVAIADREGLKSELDAVCCAHGVKGTILIAHEGINGTIAGTDEAVRTILAWLRTDLRFADLESKVSYAAAAPFKRLKIKIKPEIVSFGVSVADPSEQVGTYVRPKDWNALIQEPGVVVIDARNAYEVAIGTFAGAVDPGTRAFSEFPEFVKASLDPARTPKVAMFCTGGIRCEKASAYLLNLGFPEVYHLEGGILKYLETVPPEDSLWHGECFVFDGRVSLEHGVRPGTHVLCPVCGAPVPNGGSAADRRCCCGANDKGHPRGD